MRETLCESVREILDARFGRDTLIALATVDGDAPSVRTVNGYYENGAFYIITHAKSNKMKQLARNPRAAVCGDWFTAHGNAVNLGWFCKSENQRIAQTLRKVFEAWIDNGHNDFDDENTCILRVDLTDGVLFADGKRYDIRF